MERYKYKLLISNSSYEFEFEFKKNYYDDIHRIFTSMKISLGRSGIDLMSICKKVFLIEVFKCPFCNNDSKYDFEINLDENIIKIKGINLIQNSKGWKNYHCKSGKKCPGGLLNPNSVEYISKSFKVDNKTANNFLLERNKSPFYKNNHESEDDYKYFQSRSKESYLSKYGDDLGQKKYDSFLNNIKNNNNRESLIKKYGDELYSEICKKKSTCSLSFYISKYGEELGLIKYKEHIDKIRFDKDKFISKHGSDLWEKLLEKKRYKLTLEYFIETLGYELGTKRFTELRKSYSFTKDDFIKKYGEDKWIERYSKNTNFYSKESKIFFEHLIFRLKNENIVIENIKWLNSEFFIWDKEFRRIYFYDFYFECNNIKIIIEYDNLFWHPRKNGEKEYNKNAFSIFNKMMKPEEKMEYDERKRNIAIFYGYNIINIETKVANPVRDNKKYNDILNEVIKKIKLIIQ